MVVRASAEDGADRTPVGIFLPDDGGTERPEPKRELMRGLRLPFLHRSESTCCPSSPCTGRRGIGHASPPHATIRR